MGLDMYLSKKVYDDATNDYNNVTGTLAWKQDNIAIPINLNRIQYVLEEQAYWRKANQIYNWFDNAICGGVENCRIYEIIGEKLLELVELCKKVLAEPSLAEELLPTCDGFCFGSTEYD